MKQHPSLFWDIEDVRTELDRAGSPADDEMPAQGDSLCDVDSFSVIESGYADVDLDDYITAELQTEGVIE
jgi:hypothetical protein